LKEKDTKRKRKRKRKEDGKKKKKKEKKNHTHRYLHQTKQGYQKKKSTNFLSNTHNNRSLRYSSGAAEP
jgi:hypothetical protein